MATGFLMARDMMDMCMCIGMMMLMCMLFCVQNRRRPLPAMLRREAC